MGRQSNLLPHPGATTIIVTPLGMQEGIHVHFNLKSLKI